MERVTLNEHEKNCHPSIHYTGSVRGMIEQGYWSRNDHIVRCGSYIYNLSIFLEPSRIL